ncbi:hypothetical protein Ptr902_07119 [Pyrenophora tritici-repentis]|nr:hypothetical protein Ptr902_07119 [Pyrenophora tritici-repentis]
MTNAQPSSDGLFGSTEGPFPEQSAPMATTQPSARVPPIPLTNWGGFNPPGRGKTTSTVNDEYVQPFRGKFSGAPTQEKASERVDITRPALINAESDGQTRKH